MKSLITMIIYSLYITIKFLRQQFIFYLILTYHSRLFILQCDLYLHKSHCKWLRSAVTSHYKVCWVILALILPNLSAVLDKVGHSLFSVLLKHLFSSRIALSLTDSRSPLAAPFFCTIVKTLIVPRVPFYTLYSSYPLYSPLLIISNTIYDLCAIYSQILIIVFHFSIEFQIYIHKFIFFIHFKLSKAQTDSDSALYPQIHHVLINTLRQLCFQFSEIHI